MAKGSKCFRACYVTTVGHDKDWNTSNIGSRINANGGHHQGNKITNKTTHLAVTPKQWKTQGQVVKDALALNRDSKRNIKIVSFDWLDDIFQNQKPKPEGPYMWEKLAPKHDGDDSMNEDTSKKRKKASPKSMNGVGGPKNHVGMMAEVFQESTEKFVDAKETKRIQKQMESAKRVREEFEREEREAKEKAERDAKRAAAAFQKGAKKARNQIFSENHHIYTDATGFKYDVLLTKVDTKHNKNERWALTMYESNAEPYTYAMNAQFAGTGTRTENNVLAAMGCSFFTAFHAFKETFKERTGVKWDERVSFAIERLKREKRNRGHGTGSDDGTQKGVPVSENGVAAKGGAAEEDFATAPFLYHPPSYGPRGNLPESEKEKLRALEPQPAEAGKGKQKAADNKKVDIWMSGGNGAGPEAASVDLTSHVDNAADANDSFEADMANIFSDLGDQHGDTNNFNSRPILNPNTAAYLNFHGDNQFGEFGNAFDFPFGNDELFMSGVPTDHNGTQHISFDNLTGMEDSFEPGTQRIGETQLAEKAQGELLEHLNMPTDFDQDGTEKLAGNDAISDDPPESQEPGGEQRKLLDFGSSILGKRKTSPVDDLPETKKEKPAEVPDSFDGQSNFLGSSQGHGEDGLSTSLFMEETDGDGIEQLPNEMGDGDDTQID